ncbi:Dihydroneopterin aldolase [Galdieria sulphuraria]|nr:Dihydroneopterin aldolase [Galdieria sulphuraria]
MPYYAFEYSLDSNWTIPVFSYAGYKNFNYSVVSVSTIPSAGESIFFISEFSIDSTSQNYLLTVLGNEMFYVYLNGEFVEAQQYPIYINRSISISSGGKLRLAAQVVSSAVHKPFLYVKMIGQQDGKYYLHSTSNPSAWNWYVNEAKAVPGMINITMAMETRELYEVGTTGVSVFNTSYSHDRWPVAQTHNFYKLFSEEIQVIGPGEDRQPFGTYFVFSQFEIDTTGSYKVTLRAEDGAYTTTLTSGTHVLVAQVMNNGQGNLEVLPNGSGLGYTGFLCRILSFSITEWLSLNKASAFPHQQMYLSDYYHFEVLFAIAILSKLSSSWGRFLSCHSYSIMRDKVLLSGMTFFGRHGVAKAENELGQKFEVDIEISADLKQAGNTDRLEHTINYAEVYYLVKHIVEGEPHKLIESVAEDVAKRILSQYERAVDIRVRVMKPAVAVPGMVKGLGVEIYRSRQDFLSNKSNSMTTNEEISS